MLNYQDWYTRFGVYRFWFVDNPASAAAVEGGGCYLFLKATVWGWIPVYVGETGCFRDRFRNHEKWPEAVRCGANQVAVHPATLWARLTAERDLIDFWNPICNTKSRTGAPLEGGLMGLGASLMDLGPRTPAPMLSPFSDSTASTTSRLAPLLRCRP
jgi:hypothetical protein